MDRLYEFVVNIIIVCCVSIKCENNTEWWKYTTIYEIIMESFKDSDGDGYGDIRGFISKLDHFVDLNIETVWISPIYQSSKIDFGYDITNHTDIDPLYGTLDDFDEMIIQLKKKGLKLLIEFVPNHTSDQHIWFEKSVNREDPYTDYYVWKDSKEYQDRKAPNNWQNLYGGSAWKWNENRKQYYYHTFHINQPDLNLRNPLVLKELKNVLSFWLKRGIDGFHVTSIDFFVEDELFQNSSDDNNAYPILDLHQSHKVMNDFRNFVHEEFEKIDGKRRIFLLDKSLNHSMIENYDNYVVINFLYNLWGGSDSLEVSSWINTFLEEIPSSTVPNWMYEDQDLYRLSNTYGEEITDIANILVFLLPGTASAYYGNEIGLVNPDVSYFRYGNGIKLSKGDNLQRSPMQWDTTPSAGFTNNSKPSMYVNTDYWYRNVEFQKKIDKNNNYNLFKMLVKLRRNKTFKFGKLRTLVLSECIFAFSRSYKGEPTYIVLFNFGQETKMEDLKSVISNSSSFEVVGSSKNSGYETGYRVTPNEDGNMFFMLKPRSSIIILIDSQRR